MNEHVVDVVGGRYVLHSTESTKAQAISSVSRAFVDAVTGVEKMLTGSISTV